MAPKSGFSKNARGGRPMGVQKKNGVDAGQRLILPLNGGKHAYVMDTVTGKNKHVATGSEEFWAVVDADTADGYESRLGTEFDVLAATYPQSPWVALAAAFAARNAPADLAA